MSDCIFCSIIKDEIPSSKIFEDEKILAFKDIQPAAPVHIIIIPKKHIKSINDISNNDNELIGHIFNVAKKIAAENKLMENGYRIVTNCGKDGGQSVEHLHFHLLGGRNLNWPPD